MEYPAISLTTLLISLFGVFGTSADIVSISHRNKKVVTEFRIEKDSTLTELDTWGGLVQIDGNSQKAEFEGGPAPYSIVKLPKLNEKYTMRVEITYPAARDYGVLWPTVLLLDDKLNIVEKVAVVPKLEGAFFANKPMVKVNINPALIAYAVFYMDSTLLGKRTEIYWTRAIDTLRVSANFSQTGELQIYNFKNTPACLWSGNIDKCQPK